MLRDKDIGGVLSALAARMSRWHFASLRASRRGADELEKILGLSDEEKHPSPAAALASALERAEEGDKIVVFGSFLPVGEVLAVAQEQQDVETLKRKGRRRLVGAVALVLAAVIVLPMVFDPEPRGTGSTLSVRIPAEDETPFTPKPPRRKPRRLQRKSTWSRSARLPTRRA